MLAGLFLNKKNAKEEGQPKNNNNNTKPGSDKKFIRRIQFFGRMGHFWYPNNWTSARASGEPPNRRLHSFLLLRIPLLEPEIPSFVLPSELLQDVSFLGGGGWRSPAEHNALKWPNHGHSYVHGEPKFTDGQLQVCTDLLRVRIHCKRVHQWLKWVKIQNPAGASPVV